MTDFSDDDIQVIFDFGKQSCLLGLGHAAKAITQLQREILPEISPNGNLALGEYSGLTKALQIIETLQKKAAGLKYEGIY